MAPLTIITREEANLAPPRPSTYLRALQLDDIKAIRGHFCGPEPRAGQDVAAFLRGVQRFHTDPPPDDGGPPTEPGEGHGWSDNGYSYGVGRAGDVAEVRGLRWPSFADGPGVPAATLPGAGAHWQSTFGIPATRPPKTWNGSALTILCQVGVRGRGNAAVYVEPTTEMLDAMAALCDHLREEVGRDLPFDVHRAIRHTDCPGPWLIAYARAGRFGRCAEPSDGWGHGLPHVTVPIVTPGLTLAAPTPDAPQPEPPPAGPTPESGSVLLPKWRLRAEPGALLVSWEDPPGLPPTSWEIDWCPEGADRYTTDAQAKPDPAERKRRVSIASEYLPGDIAVRLVARRVDETSAGEYRTQWATVHVAEPPPLPGTMGAPAPTAATPSAGFNPSAEPWTPLGGPQPPALTPADRGIADVGQVLSVSASVAEAEALLASALEGRLPTLAAVAVAVERSRGVLRDLLATLRELAGA